MKPRTRIALGAFIIAAGTLPVLLSPPAPAAADMLPAGTTLVTPSREACGTGEAGRRGFDERIECGVAFTDAWLASQGLSDVLTATVITDPTTVNVWPNSVTGGLCGFGGVNGLGTSLHHCDRRTFVNPTTDAAFLRSDIDAITALSHETAHGVQEKAGIDTVTPMLTDPALTARLEQSADCWSGVAMRWYVREGMLPSTANRASRSLLARTTEADAGPHIGRVSAFDAGYRAGPSACNKILGKKVFPTTVR